MKGLLDDWVLNKNQNPIFLNPSVSVKIAYPNNVFL